MKSIIKWQQLFIIEFIKIRRSQALLMTLLCPLFVVILQLGLVIENKGQVVADKGWGWYWLGAINLWYMFMLPLYIALITMLLNAIEHKDCGWRYMATMPVTQAQIFTVKAFVGWLFVLGACLMMYLLTSLSILFMTLIGFTGNGDFDSPFFEHLLNIAISCLPILIIGHIVSWRWKNVVVPLGLGIMMTIGALTLVRSDEYWRFYPWTYHMISAMVTDQAIINEALYLSIAVALVSFVIGLLWLGRREVTV